MNTIKVSPSTGQSQGRLIMLSTTKDGRFSLGISKYDPKYDIRHDGVKAYLNKEELVQLINELNKAVFE